MLRFPSIDLFASRLNAQLPSYISWLPDPYCTQVDAFTLHWQCFYAYTFPPFILLSRVIAKTRRDRATVLLVCPLWPFQQWFPMMIQMLITHPRIIPSYYHLYLPWNLTEDHPLEGQLRLIAVKISGDVTQALAFQQTLPSFSPTDSMRLQKQEMRHITQNGLILPLKGKLLHLPLL